MNPGRTSWVGQFTPQLADGGDANVQDAVLTKDLHADPGSSLPDPAGDLRVEGLASGQVLHESLGVSLHVWRHARVFRMLDVHGVLHCPHRTKGERGAARAMNQIAGDVR